MKLIDYGVGGEGEGVEDISTLWLPLRDFSTLKIKGTPKWKVKTCILLWSKNIFQINIFDTPSLIGFNHHHLVVCLTTGPKPLPKRALHIVRSLYWLNYPSPQYEVMSQKKEVLRVIAVKNSDLVMSAVAVYWTLGTPFIESFLNFMYVSPQLTR